ncbi:GW dipeptide domain-containing protein [Psychrobacter aestuarii]|uniref:GW dipeptide domain-containing protein n=1 Tax=Psychrobacter aestuarii TaxID=556327 RepID=UPI00191A1B7C|nr:GW dipeptide domain-containing protein [Psychrobacter aestuarii]
MRAITTLFFIFILVSCTNNYDNTNINDDSDVSRKDIKKDSQGIEQTNIENGFLLENISNPLIFNKIDSSIIHDDSQKKIEIRYDNTAISINLFGDDESDLILMVNGSVIDEGFNGNFNYTYGLDLKSAIKRINVFSNDDNSKILLLPATTEEYMTYNALLFNDSGFLKAYTFEIAEWDCGDIESIIVNNKADAKKIQVIDNTGKSCDTRMYIIDGEYIKKDLKSFSVKDIEEKYEENKYKIFPFDVNADGISDIIVSNINDDDNLYQGDDLIVYLGLSSDRYLLSLDSTNYTEDGGFLFNNISPRSSNAGFILSTHFSSKGYPFIDYYFVLENNKWMIKKEIVKGYLDDNQFYCRYSKNYNVSRSNLLPDILENQVSEKDILNKCLPPPINYIVKIEKAEILNENFESRSPPNYYIKGDSIEAVSQNEDWVQVSYKNGTKFGWIDKHDLKPVSESSQ